MTEKYTPQTDKKLLLVPPNLKLQRIYLYLIFKSDSTAIVSKNMIIRAINTLGYDTKSEKVREVIDRLEGFDPILLTRKSAGWKDVFYWLEIYFYGGGEVFKGSIEELEEFKPDVVRLLRKEVRIRELETISPFNDVLGVEL